MSLKREPDGEPAIKQEKKERKVGFGDVKIKIEEISSPNKYVAKDSKEPVVIKGVEWGPGKGEGTFEKRDALVAAFSRVASSEWDTDAWQMILSEIRGREYSEVEDIYDRISKTYPTSAESLCDTVAAMEADYRYGAEEKRTKIDEFYMQVMTLPMQHAEVWRSYTEYVQRKNDFAQTQKAFGFAISRLGDDYEAHKIWKESIAFLVKRGGEFGIQNEIRKSYHARLVIPTIGLDEIWKDYITWEKSVGQFKLPEQLQADYERALFHYKALTPILKELLTKMLSRPLEVVISNDNLITSTSPLSKYGRPVKQDFEQAGLWYHLIVIEMGNPLSLEPKALSRRVQSVITKALIPMYRVPLFWYVLAKHHFDNNELDLCNIAFCNGIQTCPTSLLLRLAYSDMLRHLQAKHSLKTPVKRSGDRSKVQIVWQSQGQYISAGDEEKQAKGKFIRLESSVLAMALFSDTVDAWKSSHSATASQRALIWAFYMRFLKSAVRADGSSEKYREVYAEAVADPCTLSGEFYSAVCKLERNTPTAHTSADSSSVDPRKIIAEGFRRQKESSQINPSFVAKYADSLWEIGDEHTLRVLYSNLFQENSWMSHCDRNSVFELFNRYIEFEFWKGDLKTLHAAEDARDEEIGKLKCGTPMRKLLSRYTFQGLSPVTAEELAALEEFEFVYFRILKNTENSGDNTVGASEDVLRPHLSARDLGVNPLEENITPHTNPFRPRSRRLYVPEIRTKFVAFVIPPNRSKWQPTDDQNTDNSKLPMPASSLGTWQPSRAPQSEITGGGGRRKLSAADLDTTQMPSTVAHLARILPRNTMEGSKPKVDKIIQYFKTANFDTLDQGRIPPGKLQEAKKLLTTNGIEITNIVIPEVKEDARTKISKLRAEAKANGDSRTMRKVEKLQLALAMVSNHARLQSCDN
eukprot:TRINITY_DN4642_c0_g1_i1.p1 TRINITY_DN4642_c0_g1~~TRINITY_DN4642_c0_g1_i1.p1  ORF type:complete len:921 (+),score=155.74 TRINITY_DN4642_c0_g1_i1:295-3057(+)